MATVALSNVAKQSLTVDSMPSAEQVPHQEDYVRHIAWDFHAHAKQRGAHILAQMAPIIERCLSALDVFCLPPAAASRHSSQPDWVRACLPASAFTLIVLAACR